MSDERRIYELVNPSDPITFRATPAEAGVIAGIYRGVMLFVTDIETGEAPSLDGFEAERERIWRDAAALDSYCRAFESFLIGKVKDRLLFEEAVSHMTPDAAEAYREKWHGMKLSSMNDLCRKAWDGARAMRERGIDQDGDGE